MRVPGTPGKRRFLAGALLVAVGIAVGLGTTAAGGGLDTADLQGVRLGMTEPEVTAALAGRSGVQDVRRITKPDPGAETTSGNATYVQRLIADVGAGRTLSVVFTSPGTGAKAVEVAQTDAPPGASAQAILDDATARFGPPTSRQSRNRGRDVVAGWGGRVGNENQIDPASGVTVTLRLEVIADQSAQLTLFDHAASEIDNTRVLGGRP